MDGVVETGVPLGAGGAGGSLEDSAGEKKRKKFEHGYKSYISDLPGMTPCFPHSIPSQPDWPP